MEQQRREQVVKQIAQLVDARLRCAQTGNTEWFDNHTDTLHAIMRQIMPSGSGIDNGTKIDLDASRPDRLVFTAGFHHMNEHGYYDGWTEHKIVVVPSLAFGFRISITGRNRNDIKDYLADVYQHVLSSELEWSRTEDGAKTFRLVSDVQLVTCD